MNETPAHPAGLPDAIQAMQAPRFYPHPVTTPIRLVQTHISYVLLTGTFAYKVKKPVNFGFLDYSTLDRRRHFCEEELRLNAKGAAELYLDVVSINRSPADARLTLGGPGEAVEYAVRMRQFPPGSLLSERLAAGAVDDAEVRRVAAEVADYHRRSHTDRPVAAFGDPVRVGATIEDNYRQTRRFVGGLQPAEEFGQTALFTRQFLDTHAAAFRARAAGGRVRECHGDLHLDNVCLWDGRVLLFDCIEFNEAFRFVDVMYDVAFTVMDFRARGRADLGAVFLNEYAELTGDWEGLAVLPLYLCRHAYVRAKVNSLLSEDAGAGEAVRARAAAEARRYYHLAWQYTRPRQGRLLLVSGLSGSGKSTIARALAAKTGAVHIRSDAVRKHLAGIPLHERGGPAVYSQDMTRRTYRRLLDLGLVLARQGDTVILDARYHRAAARADAGDAANASGVPIHLLVCQAPPDVLRQRLRDRAGDIADATTDLADGQAVSWEPVGDSEADHAMTLDTTRRPEELAADVAARLGLPTVR